MSYNAATAPERLRPILEALAELHTKILQEKTLKTQSPEDLYSIQKYLYDVGNILLNGVQGNSQYNDPHLMTADIETCIDLVKKNMRPWNAHISVLTPYWIRRMYHQTPFAISKHHIENLFKNSQYVDMEKRLETDDENSSEEEENEYDTEESSSKMS